MKVQISEFTEKKFFDLFHYYFIIGLVPTFSICFYANVFVGQAKLSDIPEGYEPRHWEYYKHPIRRFFAKYLVQSFDERYEISLHTIYVNTMKDRLRGLERKVRRLQHQRGDYKGWFYRPVADHMPELERASTAEQSRGFAAYQGTQDLHPPVMAPRPKS